MVDQPRSLRRNNPQESLDSRAIEIAVEARTRIAAHEDICAERYKNLDTKFDGLQRGQEQNHHDNQDWMRRLEMKVDGLNTLSAVNDGKRAGAAWLGMTIKDWMIVIIAAAALAVNLMKH